VYGNRRRLGARLRRYVTVMGALLLSLTVVPSAAAHAVLLTTDPRNDAIVDETPAQVTLRFNEPVETAFGSLRVYDAQARRVDTGDVQRPESDTVAVGVEGPLPRGTYTATWRVVSADAHPVDGAFVFHVEAPGANPAGIAAQVLDSGTPRNVTVLFTVARFLDFALLLLAAGGVAALFVVLGTAADGVRRRLWLVLAVLAVELAVVAGLGIVLQGAAAGGFTLAEAIDVDVVSSVLDTRFGQVWAIQAGLAAALAAAAFGLGRRAESRPLRAIALLAAGGLVLTPASVGHASVSGTTAFLADVAHVEAAAAWTGGLAFLVAGLFLARDRRWPLAATAVPRFSSLALLSVAVLLVAGALNGYLQVRAWRGLWETEYGLLLMAKVALVLPLLVLGAYNNRRAGPRLRRQLASALERRRFLKAAGAELALMTAVVGVTAVLVSEPPARAEVAPKGPFATVTKLGPLELNLVVDPGRAGVNAIHLYLTDRTGRPAAVDETRVSAVLASKRIGPLRFRARRVAPGHFSVYRAQLALAGDWQLGVEARRGEFESLTTSVSVPIREEF
jgi:copper transport protein